MAIQFNGVTRGSTKYTLHFSIVGEVQQPYSAEGVTFELATLEVNKNATAQECIQAMQAYHDLVYADYYAAWVLRNNIAAAL